MPIFNLNVTGGPGSEGAPGTYFGPGDPTAEVGVGNPDAMPGKLSAAGRKLLSALSLPNPGPESPNSSLRPSWVAAGLAALMAVAIAGGVQRHDEIVAGTAAPVISTAPGFGYGDESEHGRLAFIAEHRLNPRLRD